MAIAGLILSVSSFILGFGLILLHWRFNPPNFMWHFKTF